VELSAVSERSLVPWSPALLCRVADIAKADAACWQQGRPRYVGTWLGSVLVQGGARHLLDPAYGVKDVDVLALYANPNPPGHRGHGRRHAVADLGPSPLGVHPADAARGYTGRRVDLLVRDLPVAPGTPLADALVPWLTAGAAACPGPYLGDGGCTCGRGHTSAWCWAQTPVVALCGAPLGTVVWPAPARSRSTAARTAR